MVQGARLKIKPGKWTDQLNRQEMQRLLGKDWPAVVMYSGDDRL